MTTYLEWKLQKDMAEQFGDTTRPDFDLQPIIDKLKEFQEFAEACHEWVNTCQESIRALDARVEKIEKEMKINPLFGL